MHIGKYKLNENEENWTKEWVEKTLNKCASDLTAALNKKIEVKDVKKLLGSREEKKEDVEEKEEKPAKKSEKKRNKKGFFN